MGANVLDLMTVRRGHFRYESGYHGEVWLDLDRLFLDPRRIAPLPKTSRRGSRDATSRPPSDRSSAARSSRK